VLTALKAVQDAILTALKAVQDTEKKSLPQRSSTKTYSHHSKGKGLLAKGNNYCYTNSKSIPFCSSKSYKRGGIAKEGKEN
jgi:hypothetical protein